MEDYQGLFIKELDEGKEQKVCWMSHNAYWSPLYGIDERYESAHIDVFGGSTAYLRKDRIRYDYDLIAQYSSNFFSDDELEDMKEIANRISETCNKRVSIGYLSFVPEEERTDESIKCVLNFVSFKDGNCIQKKLLLTMVIVLIVIVHSF